MERRIFVLRPPYLCYEPFVAGPPHAGQFLVVDETWFPLDDRIIDLRRQHPATGVILLTATAVASDLLLLERLSASYGIRAVVHEREVPAAVLRARLTAPGRLASVVTEWVELIHGPLDPSVRSCLDQVFLDNGAGGFGRLAAGSPGALRSKLHRAGLPSPKRLLALRKLIVASLIIQGNPGKPLAAAAVEAGFHDQPAMANALRQRLGVTPSRMKALLGFDWILGRCILANRSFVSN